MSGLDSAIHGNSTVNPWMPGTSQGMTMKENVAKMEKSKAR
jgi:hypothetical protein